MSLSGVIQQQALDLQSHLLCLGNQINNKSLSIEEIGDVIPGSVMVQDLNSMTNLYMNRFGCDILHHSSEELTSFGPEYFLRFFPAEELIVQKHALFQFIAQQDYTKLHSFLQRVRPDVNSDYDWYFTTSRLVPSKFDPQATNLVHISVPVNTLNLTGFRISSMIENDEYIKRNFQRFNLLSAREKEVI